MRAKRAKMLRRFIQKWSTETFPKNNKDGLSFSPRTQSLMGPLWRRQYRAAKRACAVHIATDGKNAIVIKRVGATEIESTARRFAGLAT
jgi:hypothetical protein